MQQEDQRVAVFLHDLIPDERPPQADQRGQRRRLAEARASLNQGQALIERVGQELRHARPLQRARARARRDDFGADDGSGTDHEEFIRSGRQTTADYRSS